MATPVIARRVLVSVAVLFCVLAAPPVRAELGPCKADDHDGLIRGSGDGAARVIDETVSPSKRFALAWRVKDGPIEDMPDQDKIELLLLRISDGAVLAQDKTEYWNTGKMHVNRLQEQASWSPNSRLAVRTFHSRFSTDNVDLFAIDKDAAAATSLDLLKTMDKAVRATLKQKARNADDYVFSLRGGKDLTVSNDGLVRAHVMMWIPKDGPERNYAVTVQVAQRAKGGLAAQVVSITPALPRRD